MHGVEAYVCVSWGESGQASVRDYVLSLETVKKMFKFKSDIGLSMCECIG